MIYINLSEEEFSMWKGVYSINPNYELIQSNYHFVNSIRHLNEVYAEIITLYEL
jgi:hypothetical protein